MKLRDYEIVCFKYENRMKQVLHDIQNRAIEMERVRYEVEKAREMVKKVLDDASVGYEISRQELAIVKILHEELQEEISIVKRIGQQEHHVLELKSKRELGTNYRLLQELKEKLKNEGKFEKTLGSLYELLERQTIGFQKLQEAATSSVTSPNDILQLEYAFKILSSSISKIFNAARREIRILFRENVFDIREDNKLLNIQRKMA